MTVLVTGAGGSIGSEVCRKLVGRARNGVVDAARLLDSAPGRRNKPVEPASSRPNGARVDLAATCAPGDLILFEHSEYALYRIAQETGGRPILGDCRDRARVTEIFERYRPDLVIHAAAYKHVPLLEGENSFVGVKNNVLGTLATASVSHGLGARYVLISTDKAVNPSCVMGSSKRVCELVAAELGGVIVRFGNVAGSAGSVLPAFLEQIATGGPVTVTHPDVSRYFMEIPQAADLILVAAAIGRPARTYMLDMGATRKIVDIAREMIAASGRDIPIQFIGLRPGEKLSEELHYAHERKSPTAHPGIYALAGDMPPIVHRLGWLSRGSASPEETRRWLAHVLSPAGPQSLAHVAQREPAVVQH